MTATSSTARYSAGTRRFGLAALLSSLLVTSLLTGQTTATPAEPADAGEGFCVAPGSVGQANAFTRIFRKENAPPRTIVTSDAEIDDVASFHRLLFYANDFADSLEGIVYSSSRFHWAGDPDANPPIPAQSWAGTTVFQELIGGGGEWGPAGGYAAVYENLRRHDPRYPSPEHLLSLVKIGNITNVHEMARDTEGSLFIKEKLLDDEPGPLWLQIWGGTNTVAAALRSIQEEYEGTAEWDEIKRKVSEKAHLHIILDQDNTYANYVAPNWPDIRVIVNRDQFWSVAYQSFRATRVPVPLNEAYFGQNQPGGGFMQNIVHGPLLQTYPVSDAGAFVSEGDSPSYFQHLPLGLRSANEPTWGGWGGRFDQVDDYLWTDFPSRLGRPGDRTEDNPGPLWSTLAHRRAAPQTRWIPALQHDFWARSNWQELSFDEANHPPVTHLPPGRRDIGVRPGQRIQLVAQAADVDGDALTCNWWHYPEAGTYEGTVDLDRADTLRPTFVVPSDAQPGDTIHLILDVTDTGTPELTRYARVVATVS